MVTLEWIDRQNQTDHSKDMGKRSAKFFGFSLIAVLLLAVSLSTLGVLFPKQPEPLADPATLKLLAEGRPVPIPSDEKNGEFHGMHVIPPSLASLKLTTRVLGVSDPNNKRIEVDLTHQHLYAFEGDRKVYDFLVSTGKWGRTPTGTFTIANKLVSTTMSGGSGATYYYLPKVPYVMFFGNNEVPWSRGFSLHGTYWHNNFGHPMSHGCVNMRTEDAKVLFQWATPVVTDAKAWSTAATPQNPGTTITIYGEPRE